ncbi:MAG: type II secretion system protein [Candidatus Eremiobacteraeota bacterium]|nr:type II secretion system protein [Candidatus Eremiobacteraeota bacterium]
MNRPRRGTTLAELLVVLMVFAILMTLVLGFYLYGVQVSHKRDQDSDQYRRGVTLLNKVETYVNSSVLHAVTYGNDAIVFSSVSEQSIGKGRTLQLEPSASTIAVQDGKVLLYSSGELQVLARLQSWESLKFELPAGSEKTRPDYLDVVYQASPPEDPQPHSLTRRVVLERF